MVEPVAVPEPVALEEPIPGKIFNTKTNRWINDTLKNRKKIDIQKQTLKSGGKTKKKTIKKYKKYYKTSHKTIKYKK